MRGQFNNMNPPKKTQNYQRKFQLSILCKYSHENNLISHQRYKKSSDIHIVLIMQNLMVSSICFFCRSVRIAGQYHKEPRKILLICCVRDVKKFSLFLYPKSIIKMVKPKPNICNQMAKNRRLMSLIYGFNNTSNHNKTNYNKS